VLAPGVVMPDRLDEIAERLRAVEAEMSRVSARLDALEHQASGHATGASDQAREAQPESLPLLPVTRADLGSSLSLTGRTFIVLGGAFLLRALTESSRVPARVGVVLGLAYAVAWIVAADRAARHRNGISALFHGLTGVLVGLPLLWETSTTFGVLSATGCAAALGLFTTLTLVVSDRQRLRTLALVALTGALSIAVPLAVMTNGFVPFAVLLVVLVAITLVIAARRQWAWLAWPAAFIADSFLFVLTARAGSVGPPTTASTALTLSLALLVVTIGYLVARAMGPPRRLTLFEMAQTVVAVALGLGSSLWLGAAAGVPRSAVGAITLAVALLAYLTVVRVLAPRGRTARTTQFFATMGLVLVLAGMRALVPGAALPLILAAIALTAAWCSRRQDSATATLHGLAYAVGALVAAGWTSQLITSWVGVPTVWPSLDVPLLATFGVAWMCLLLRPSSDSRIVSFARMGYAVSAVLVTSAVLLTLLGPLVAGSPADAGVLATLRTAVLTIGAILVAACARIEAVRDFSALVYPVLICGGFKLVAEDFGHSRPATLFIALALFGAALVIAPKLAKR
jgi:hypothetical protein